MKLTKGEQKFLDRLTQSEYGFVSRSVHFGRSQSNRCAYSLEDKGLIESGSGPKGSFLKTQGWFLKNKT